MRPTITAFESSPDEGQGLARDMRVRWALEEVGQQYDVRLLSFRALKEPAHRSLNPFGSIPTYEEGDLALFESGAIILHIAERHAGLLPDDANSRARAIMWMFAALCTTSSQTWPPTSPAAKRAPPTSEPSTPNGRSTPPGQRPADCRGLPRAGSGIGGFVN